MAARRLGALAVVEVAGPGRMGELHGQSLSRKKEEEWEEDGCRGHARVTWSWSSGATLACRGGAVGDNRGEDEAEEHRRGRRQRPHAQGRKRGRSTRKKKIGMMSDG
jgi:hypothetical protein